jgi:ABC-type branched-subunit amino acid transport system substrate-binding protein
MRSRTIGLAVAAAVAAGAGFLELTGGCGSTAAGGGKGAVDPAGPPLVIGASIGLTGSLSGNSTAMQGGLLAAVAQINALGGILGREVVVSTQDDQSDPNQALTVAQSLVGMGVSSLIGPLGSGEVVNVEPFITMKKVVEVSSTATSAQLTQGNAPKAGYFFRTVPSDAYQAVAVALFAAQGPGGDAGAPMMPSMDAGGGGGKDGGTGDAATDGSSASGTDAGKDSGPASNPGGGCRRMDVIHNNDAYGNPLSKAIEAYFTAHGGTLGSDIPVPTNALGDYTSEVTQVVGDAPGCLVLAVYPQTAATFMQNLSMAIMPTPKGWSPSFFVIGTDGTYDPSLITDGLANPTMPMGTSFVQGMYGTVALTNNQNRSEYGELLAIYEAEVGLGASKTDMDPYTSNQYDAIVLALLAMEAAGTTTNGPAIQQAMFNVSRGKSCGATPYTPAQLGDAITALQKGSDINYQGASGDVDFDDYGDVIADFLVWEVVGQGFAPHSTISSTQLSAAQTTMDAGGCSAQ